MSSSERDENRQYSKLVSIAHCWERRSIRREITIWIKVYVDYQSPENCLSFSYLIRDGIVSGDAWVGTNWQARESLIGHYPGVPSSWEKFCSQLYSSILNEGELRDNYQPSLGAIFLFQAATPEAVTQTDYLREIFFTNFQAEVPAIRWGWFRIGKLGSDYYLEETESLGGFRIQGQPYFGGKFSQKLLCDWDSEIEVHEQ